MRLEYTCAQCKIQNKFVPVEATRGQLQMKVGDEVEVKCNYCNKIDTKHINRIDAVADNKKVLIAFIASIVLSVLLFFFFGWIGSLVISIPILMWVQEGKSTSDFNKYKIRRR